MSLPVITFMGFASFVEFDMLVVLLEIIDNGCHCRSLIAVRHQRGFSLRLGDQASKDVVELFLSEKRGHGGDAEDFVFVGVVPGSCYGCDDGILVCVLAVGAALDQLVAGPLFTADGCLKRIVLDVGGPSDQLVDATENFFDLFICQQRRLPELELGKLHVDVGSFTAVSFGLAELAPFAAVVFTVSVKGKLCSRGQNLIGPLVEFVPWNGEGADVGASGLVDGHADGVDVVDVVEQLQRTEGVQLHLRVVVGFDQNASAVLASVPAGTPTDDWEAFAKATRLKAGVLKKIRPYITEKDPTAQPIEGEADVDLRDTENVPFTYEGGIDAFMQNEVLPYAPDAFIDSKKTQIGYEVSFTKYFYKPVELRDLSDILASLNDLEKEADGMLSEIVGGVI